MPITAKTILTRAERRAVLRIMLRDAGATVWSDSALNVALDEAATIAQSRYPLVQRALLPLTSATVYALPDECLKILRVAVVPARGGLEAGELAALEVTALQGVELASGAYALTANGYDKSLHLTGDYAVGDTLLIWYYAAQQPWGTPADVNAGRDLVALDLAPNQLQDGQVGLLFYAAARRAAQRYAMQVIASGGGREFEKEYVMADEEFKLLMGTSGQLRPLRRSTGLF